MHKQLQLWQFIAQHLQQQPVMLLYVLQSVGSSPGRQGFAMAVTADYDMCGSIGGGMMEHKLVELAKSQLQQPHFKQQIIQQIHSKTAAKNQSGMICSGEQTVWMYLVQPHDAVTIQQIIASLQQHQHGCLKLLPEGLFFETTVPPQHFLFDYKADNDFLYCEKTGYKQVLYLIGGGHCSLAFAQLMQGLDFYIHLIEDRPHLNTFWQNPFVHQKHIVNHYSEVDRLIADGHTHYVVIMTFGYRTDALALQALYAKKLAYLGMLGSKNKITQLLHELKTAGKIQGDNPAFFAPIGLSIKSQTPEEIAVSIAAQIIQQKNRHL